MPAANTDDAEPLVLLFLDYEDARHPARRSTARPTVNGTLMTGGQGDHVAGQWSSMLKKTMVWRRWRDFDGRVGADVTFDFADLALRRAKGDAVYRRVAI